MHHPGVRNGLHAVVRESPDLFGIDTLREPERAEAQREQDTAARERDEHSAWNEDRSGKTHGSLPLEGFGDTGKEAGDHHTTRRPFETLERPGVQ